jgi:GT2 family glycosyltransferase
MTVTILIINWNGANYIKETLSRLLSQPGNVKVLIIDNGSEDDSVNVISQNFPQFKLIANPQHLSFTECLNYGLSQAVSTGSEYIWLINPDMLVEDNSLKELIEIGDKYKDVGMISSKIYVYPNKDNLIYYAGGIMDWFNLRPVNRGQGQIDAGQFEHDVETDFVLPLSVLIKNRIINEVGLLDPAYFYGYDWLDYCFKIKRYAWRMMYSCQSHVWYSAVKEEELSPTIKEYYTIRNQLLFGLRHGPFYTKFTLLKNAFHQYFFGRPWQRRAVLDFFTGNFGRGSYQDG